MFSVAKRNAYTCSYYDYETNYLILMMLLTICSVRGAINWSGRLWSRQNFVATASAESPSFMWMCSTHPSSISTVIANSVLRPLSFSGWTSRSSFESMLESKELYVCHADLSNLREREREMENWFASSY